MKNFGFSLIELLIVIVLFGIISMISYPSYNNHLIRVRRIHMTVMLLDVAARMEKYYIAKNTYDGADKENLSIDDSSYQDHYLLNIKPEGSFYTLEAAPIGKQEKDVRCGTLIFDQDGRRGAMGVGDVAKCW